MPSIKILFVISLLVLIKAERDKKNMFTIEVKGLYTDGILENFEHIWLRLLYKITPSVYIFKYNGHKETHQLLKHVRNIFPDLVSDIEPIRVYNNTFKPTFAESEDRKLISSENLVCGNYYGMSVPEVWKQNITGKGVTIAVNDVGINADQYDLKRNIGNCSLCKNFISNTTDTNPESFEELLDKAPRYVDHGNNIAGIAAAEKDNNFCSAGIAYDARIVVLKVHEVVLDSGNIFLKSYWTSSDVISRSFSYNLDKIDIIINAWATDIPFDHLELSTRKSIIHGAAMGRNGLGTIYVVAAGPVGNELTNNINTISVSSIGIRGSQPVDAILDSSVLISGLHEGNNISSSFMVTTSHGDRCVKNFNGVSAAVSQISGIIALGLQANPNLTVRDVQHILVKASDIEHLEEKIAFRKNGASLHFHNIFGFGLLNADKFVHLALNNSPTAPLLSNKMNEYTKRFGFRKQTFDFIYSCVKECITSIEHVVISISFTTTTEILRAQITSPSDTESTIMDLKVHENDIPYSKRGNVVTVHFWNEEPQGKWYVTIQNKHHLDNTDVHYISVTIYGTGGYDKNDSRKDTRSAALYYLFFILIIPAGIVCAVVVKKKKGSNRKKKMHTKAVAMN